MFSFRLLTGASKWALWLQRSQVWLGTLLLQWKSRAQFPSYCLWSLQSPVELCWFHKQENHLEKSHLTPENHNQNPNARAVCENGFEKAWSFSCLARVKTTCQQKPATCPACLHPIGFLMVRIFKVDDVNPLMLPSLCWSLIKVVVQLFNCSTPSYLCLPVELSLLLKTLKCKRLRYRRWQYRGRHKMINDEETHRPWV